VTNVLPGCKGVVQCDGSIQAELGSIQWRTCCRTVRAASTTGARCRWWGWLGHRSGRRRGRRLGRCAQVGSLMVPLIVGAKNFLFCICWDRALDRACGLGGGILNFSSAGWGMSSSPSL
jgi:hypothetical protein